jgi:hypothetical protein
MRIIAFLTAPAVLDRILTHLRTRDTLRAPAALAAPALPALLPGPRLDFRLRE